MAIATRIERKELAKSYIHYIHLALDSISKERT
jgi:hypothetical protein